MAFVHFAHPQTYATPMRLALPVCWLCTKAAGLCCRLRRYEQHAQKFLPSQLQSPSPSIDQELDGIRFLRFSSSHAVT